MYSCWSMSKMPSPPLHMESLARCMEGCIFPVPEEDVCSFFNILFDIVRPKYKFGLRTKRVKRVWLFTIIVLLLKGSLTLL